MLRDHEGNPIIEANPKVLYVHGQLSYKSTPGRPRHHFDLDEDGGDMDENGELAEEPPETYLRWTGRCTWIVTVIHHDDRWHSLYLTESAREAFAKMRELGAEHGIEVDERLHISDHNAAEAAFIRQDAALSMAAATTEAGATIVRPDFGRSR